MESTLAQGLDIQQDGWLSAAMGYPVYRVVPTCGDRDSSEWRAAMLDELVVHGREQARALYYAKIDVASVPLLHVLDAAGMQVVDVNVTLEIPAGADRPAGAAAPGVEVVPARPEHAGDLLQIAGNSFRFSRLHLDPRIPRATADHVRQAWVRSYLDGQRGDRLFVALVEGRVAGFLAALVSPMGGRRVAVLDLMGVSVAEQRRGVGRALVEHWWQCYRPACEILRVGTQAANIPALRLYETCGFRMTQAAYVLHLHVE